MLLNFCRGHQIFILPKKKLDRFFTKVRHQEGNRANLRVKGVFYNMPNGERVLVGVDQWNFTGSWFLANSGKNGRAEVSQIIHRVSRVQYPCFNGNEGSSSNEILARGSSIAPPFYSAAASPCPSPPVIFSADVLQIHDFLSTSSTLQELQFFISSSISVAEAPSSMNGVDVC